MKTIGETLRHNREKMNLSIKHISNSTNIMVRYLEALEKENYSVFPGEIINRPPLSSSRMAPKTLGESKRGKHNQSMDPLIPTRAAECISPIIP